MQPVLEQGSIDKTLTFDVGLIELSFIPVCSPNTATFQSNCAEGLNFNAFHCQCKERTCTMYDTMYDCNRKRACTRSHLQVVNEYNRPVSGLFTWTALNRKDKLKVLQMLPDAMSCVLPEEDATQIGKLWKVCTLNKKITYIHVP